MDSVIKVKAGQRVAGEIMTEILERGWPVGELLGTEAELMTRYGVSRASLSEAIRQVERRGAATMRRGIRGGLTVAAPATDIVAKTISTYLELADVGLDEQFEVWRIIEVYAVGLAARQIDADGVSELRHLVSLIDQAEGPFDYLQRCLAVRTGIADKTSNPALALFMRVLIRVLSRAAPSSVRVTLSPTGLKMRDHLHDMVEAIAGGDAALAQGIARLNLDMRQEDMARISGAGRQSTNGAAAKSEGDPPQKLANTIARRIRDDIAGLGWPEGSKLGDEAELLERYEVSRWVLRQALRTLEVHSIVWTKRGQGGGLIIGRADPGETIASAVAYLHFTQFTLDEVSEVWGVLIENAAHLAGLRAAQTDFGALLGVIEAEEAARSLAKFRDASREFYIELGRCSGNRVLHIFITILVRFIATYKVRQPTQPIQKVMKQYRRRIAEAAAAGDAGLARRAMADYMQTVRPYYTSGIGSSAAAEQLSAGLRA